MESTCARLETYIASFTGCEIASRIPVSSAEAIALSSPESEALMRLSITARICAMAVT